MLDDKKMQVLRPQNRAAPRISKMCFIRHASADQAKSSRRRLFEKRVAQVYNSQHPPRERRRFRRETIPQRKTVRRSGNTSFDNPWQFPWFRLHSTHWTKPTFDAMA